MKKLENKVAVITGGADGIGKAAVELFASEGAKVVIWDMNEVKGKETADSLTAKGMEVTFMKVNTADFHLVENAANQVNSSYGRIDILINNAGITRDSTLKKMTPDQWQSVIDVNLTGVFNCTKCVSTFMTEQNYGRIVNTSSVVALYGNFGQTNYGAAKMGLVGFTRVLAAEGAKYNIKANAIAPLALTRMTENLMGALGDKLDPALVTPIVAWLAHEDCDVTGEIYSVGGGRVARVFIGETQGFFKPGLTLEDVRDNWAQIRNTDGYVIPSGVPEETGLFFTALKDA